MTKILAKMKDGSPIVIEHTDLGEVARTDANGRPYTAYASRFEWGNSVCVVEIDKELALASGNVAQFRMVEDMAQLSLEIPEVDFDTVEFSD